MKLKDPETFTWQFDGQCVMMWICARAEPGRTAEPWGEKLSHFLRHISRSQQPAEGWVLYDLFIKLQSVLHQINSNKKNEKATLKKYLKIVKIRQKKECLYKSFLRRGRFSVMIKRMRDQDQKDQSRVQDLDRKGPLRFSNTTWLH